MHAALSEHSAGERARATSGIMIDPTTSVGIPSFAVLDISAGEKTEQSDLSVPVSPTTQLLIGFAEAPVLIITVWCAIWLLVGVEALPMHGKVFCVIVVWVVANCSGLLVKTYCACARIPPLIGMLLAGVALRSLPHPLDVAESVDHTLGSELRNIAYCIVLCRAGLALDIGAVSNMLGPALRLAFMPNIVEAVVAAILANLILGFPWFLAFAAGFLLSAISPAIVVPTLLSLQEEGYGKEKGIASLVVVAAGLDDVLSITAVGVFCELGIPKQGGDVNIAWGIAKAPLQVFLGIVGGYLMGRIFVPLTAGSGPHRRTSFLLCASIVGVFGGKALGMSGMGALFVLAFGSTVLNYGPEQVKTLKVDLQWLWDVMQPFLFGLIGAQVEIADLNLAFVGRGLIVLFSALICRCLVAAIVPGNMFTTKERVFFGCAWVPKATVQAALGGTALDMAIARNAGTEMQEYGNQISTLAVLAIMFTAPLGAILINVFAPKLLSRPALDEALGTSLHPM